MQRTAQVRLKIREVLEPDAEAHGPGVFARLRSDTVLDERLDAAERRRRDPEARLVTQPRSALAAVVPPAREPDGEGWREAARHLRTRVEAHTLGQLLRSSILLVWPPRLERAVRDPADDACSAQVLVLSVQGRFIDRLVRGGECPEPGGELGGRLRLACDANGQRAEGAEEEEALKIARGGAGVRAVVPERGGGLLVADREDAHEHVRVPAKVLGRGVHDHVRAMREGVLKWRRRERRVDRECATGRMRLLGVVCNIPCFARRVQGCFKPDKESAALGRVRLVQVDKFLESKWDFNPQRIHRTRLELTTLPFVFA
jgi:hypothetical protein